MPLLFGSVATIKTRLLCTLVTRRATAVTSAVFIVNKKKRACVVREMELGSSCESNDQTCLEVCSRI